MRICQFESWDKWWVYTLLGWIAAYDMQILRAAGEASGIS